MMMLKATTTAAVGVCLLVVNLATFASADEQFYPISIKAPVMGAPPPENTNVRRIEDSVVLPTPTAVLDERFFPCSECPAPYPNSVYTPPTRRNPMPTGMIQGNNGSPEAQCQNDDIAKPVVDSSTNVTYNICCPMAMSTGTRWHADRGLQCCSDQYMLVCKHDPVNATSCGAGFILIADAMSHINVCKDSGADENASTVTTSSLTTSSAASLESTAITAIETASTTNPATTSATAMESTAASSSRAATGGGAKVGLYELGFMFSAELGAPAIIMIIMAHF